MSELKDMLQGVAAAKERGFADEDFAGGYGRVVTGRVKRRRAATSVGVGGASVLGASALAVGVMNVPWGVLGTASPGSQGVVCTTTTPVVAEGPVQQALPLVTFAVVETGTNEVIFIGWSEDGSTPHAWNQAYDKVRAEAVGIDAVYRFASGVGVRVMSGEERGVLNVPDYEVIPIADYEEQVLGEAVGAMVTSVQCVTTTPDPSEPAPSGTATHSRESLPEPSESATLGPVVYASPFQCGFEFPSEEHSNDVIAVGDTVWLAADAAKAEIRATYANPDEALLRVSGDPVPVTSVSLIADWYTAETPGMIISGDAAEVTAASAEEFARYGTYVVGVQYVLVADGRVVATRALGSEAQPQYWELDMPSLDLYGLDLVDGMAVCEGVTQSTLADAEVAAVASIVYEHDDTRQGPYYAWRVLGQP